MVKIDLKDRKILYQLDLNSRQSLSQIGRKVGLSKVSVGNRIKRLEEQGIIKNYYTVIDSSKLGYISFRFYLVYQDTTPEIEKEILDYFVNNKNTWWVASLRGGFNLAVAVWVKNVYDFHVFWEKTLIKYRDYFQKQVFSVYFQLSSFRYSFLLLDEYKKGDREEFEIAGSGRRVEIDELDSKILNVIASNSRIPLTQISEKLHSSVTTLKKRINKLIKLKIILGFRINIDHLKLGLQIYKIDINLNNYRKRKQIIDYIALNPHLSHLAKSAGIADLELGVFIENPERIHQMMKDLIVKFPNLIKNYNYFYQSKIHKMLYMPEE
jgi:DNA-binding Lrp family transcriptional regulator